MDVNVISHNQLKHEGWSFNDSAAGTSWSRNGVTIPLKLKHGMCYWSGKLAKPDSAVQPDDDGYEEEINAMTQAQVTAICGATESPAALKQMLDEPAVRDNTQKRNIVRKRLAECGEYCANCPKTDKLLQFYCKYGHCSWRNRARCCQ